MKILTLENLSYDIDNIGREVSDIYFWILEYTGIEESTDYFAKPLLFLEIFDDIRLELAIGKYKFHMPKDWSILCVDKELGDSEILQPKMPGFNEKDFSAFVYNPMSGFRADHYGIEVLTPLPVTKWVFPKLRFGQMLGVPLTDDEKPPCVFITHQKNNKVPEVINSGFLT